MRPFWISLKIACALFVFSACSFAQSHTNRVTITFAARAEEQQFYDPLIATFNTDNPTLRVQFVALDEHTSTIPQIVRAADTAAVFFVPPHERTEAYLRNLQPLMAADPAFTRDAFYPNAFAASADPNRIVLLPQTLYVPLLSYNKDLWVASGLLEPTPDWRWADLSAAAEQLSARAGDTITRYGLLDMNDGVHAVVGELVTAGIDPATMQTARLTDPLFATALERTLSLVKMGALYPVGAAENTALRQLITEQQVALWPTELFLPAAQVEPPSFAVGTVPYPQLPLATVTNAASGYIMSSGTQHPQEAWRWLAFLSCQAAGSLENFRGVVAVPACRALSETSATRNNLDASTRAAIDAALNRPPVPDQALLDEQRMGALIQAARTVREQQQPLAAALDAAQRTLEQQQTQPTPSPDTQPIVVATPIPPPPVANVQTITFAPVGVSGFTEDMRRVAQVFMEQHPDIAVKIKEMDMNSELERIAAETDCFMWYRSPQANEVTELLDLQPLMDTASARIPPDDYPVALLARFKQDTRLLGLPDRAQFKTLSYNREAFDAAGIAYPTAEWTPDDLRGAAQQLTTGNGDTRHYGIAVVSPPQQFIWFFLDRFGVSALRGSGADLQPNYTDPQVRTALRYMVDMLRDFSPHQELMGYMNRSSVNDTTESLITAGRVGIWFDPVMRNPHHPSSVENPTFTVAMAPPPLGKSSVTSNDMTINKVLYISAHTQQAAACWEWFQALSTDLTMSGDGFPVRQSVVESDQFIQQASPGALDIYRAYRKALDRTGSVTGPSAFDQEEVDYFWFYRTIDRALQGKDLDQELQVAQTLTEQYLACTRGGGQGDTCATQVDPTYQGQ